MSVFILQAARNWSGLEIVKVFSEKHMAEAHLGHLVMTAKDKELEVEEAFGSLRIGESYYSIKEWNVS